MRKRWISCALACGVGVVSACGRPEPGSRPESAISSAVAAPLKSSKVANELGASVGTKPAQADSATAVPVGGGQGATLGLDLGAVSTAEAATAAPAGPQHAEPTALEHDGKGAANAPTAAGTPAPQGETAAAPATSATGNPTAGPSPAAHADGVQAKLTHDPDKADHTDAATSTFGSGHGPSGAAGHDDKSHGGGGVPGAAPNHAGTETPRPAPAPTATNDSGGAAEHGPTTGAHEPTAAEHGGNHGAGASEHGTKRGPGTIRLLAPPGLAALAQAWTVATLGERIVLDEPVSTSEERMALADVAAGRAHAALVFRPPTEAEFAAAADVELESTVVATDALVLVIDNDVRAKRVTVADAQRLFGGEWQLPGVDRLVLASDGSAPGHLRRGLLGDGPLSLPTTSVADDRAVLRMVTQEEGAMGLVSHTAASQVRRLPLVDASGKALPAPAGGLQASSWPILRPLYLVVRADAPDAVKRLLRYALGPDGRSLAARKGYLAPEAWGQHRPLPVAGGDGS